MTALSLPTFSVIIPTYNRAEIVARTVRHFMAQDYPPDRFEVLLVDNSTDRTPQLVEELAAESRCSVRVIATHIRLPARKRNLGLAQAQFDYALFFNDDVWVEPNLLREHAQTHAEHDAPIAVLGLVEQSTEMPWSPFQEVWRPFAYDDIADRAHKTVPYRYFWSMNLSLPRRVMIDRNLVFHEDWAEIGHEDVELGYRWTRAGYEIVYNPRARGEHFHPMTFESGCAFAESIGRGLRDLHVLVPDPDLLGYYGVFSRRNRPRKFVRGLIREVLFNPWTVPFVQRWLSRRKTSYSWLAKWLGWKVMLFYCNRGFRRAPQRHPTPVPTRPLGDQMMGA
ncbi:MAG TPA: glycosyltransferase family 2 protein [Chloroflexota bacterium]|nr:glycosyltransferase family 2 protein [Chloroflexota bacterium]